MGEIPSERRFDVRGLSPPAAADCARGSRVHAVALSLLGRSRHCDPERLSRPLLRQLPHSLNRLLPCPLLTSPSNSLCLSATAAQPLRSPLSPLSRWRAAPCRCCAPPARFCRCCRHCCCCAWRCWPARRRRSLARRGRAAAAVPKIIGACGAPLTATTIRRACASGTARRAIRADQDSTITAGRSLDALDRDSPEEQSVRLKNNSSSAHSQPMAQRGSCRFADWFCLLTLFVLFLFLFPQPAS